MRTKALLTPQLDSPSSVRSQQRKIVRLPSQSVIGEKNLLAMVKARFRPLVLTDRVPESRSENRFSRPFLPDLPNYKNVPT